MADLIAFDAKTQVFHLHNQQISYIFAIEDGGVLGHLYFGQAVAGYHGERHYPRKDRGFAGNLPVADPERGFSLDTLPQEISSRGEADFRIPAFVICQADGAQASRFIYASHRIVPGKPKLPGLPAAYVESPDEAATLIVTVVDQPSRLQADLYYTIYRDRAVIARSVCFRNPADQPPSLWNRLRRSNSTSPPATTACYRSPRPRQRTSSPERSRWLRNQTVCQHPRHHQPPNEQLHRPHRPGC